MATTQIEAARALPSIPLGTMLLAEARLDAELHALRREIGTRIRRERLARELTLEQIRARSSGRPKLKVPLLSLLERGKRWHRRTAIQAIAALDGSGR